MCVSFVAPLVTLGIVTACLESCSGIAEPRRAGSGVVYVSFAPGTMRGGATIAIDNLAIHLSLTAVLVNGGLDPVAVAARPGDTLKLIVTDSSGASRPPQFLLVAIISPEIVRTDPPPGGTDVALNTQTVVVFSEPIDPQTVTTQTIQVRLNGQPLPGTVILSSDGLLGEFRPAAPLLPQTAYTLVVTTGVGAITGLRLAQGTVVTFTTGGGAGQIAFVSNRTGKAQIFVMAPDGTRPTQLTYDTAGAGGPSWSADGTRMSFVRHGNLYVMNADGTGVVHLFTDQQSDGAATWSPDGTRLAFERCCDRLGYSQIYLVNSDGTGLVRLTTDPRFHEWPAWSPDGSKIAYHGFAGVAAGQQYPDIYVINVDGTGLTDLTPNSPTQDMYPAWSPDGHKIAFASHRSGGMQIFVMNADGTGVLNLTNDSTAVVLNPTWSPSGLRIAFMGHANGNEEIFVMNADGSGVVNVTNNPAADEDPQWSPP
jgi:Tol biopolymer transport system component